VIARLTGPTPDLEDLVRRLKVPRAAWVMLPAGEITEKSVEQLGGLLAAGDTIIDGGNAFYKDDIRRAKALKSKGIDYIDCGTSGGVWGLERGYSLMIGGAKDAVERLDPIFSALAPGRGEIAATPDREGRDPRVERGYMHCGRGAGRFVKMVHNGIEYGSCRPTRRVQHSCVGRPRKATPGALSSSISDIAEVCAAAASWLLAA
jgi:6-phosphogluconate dehydrogenase